MGFVNIIEDRLEVLEAELKEDMSKVKGARGYILDMLKRRIAKNEEVINELYKILNTAIIKGVLK